MFVLLVDIDFNFMNESNENVYWVGIMSVFVSNYTEKGICGM